MNPGPLHGFLPTSRFGPRNFGKEETPCSWRSQGSVEPRSPTAEQERFHHPAYRAGKSSSYMQPAQSSPFLAPLHSTPGCSPHLHLAFSLTLNLLLVGHAVRPGARALLMGNFLTLAVLMFRTVKNQAPVLKGSALCGEGLCPHHFLNSCYLQFMSSSLMLLLSKAVG